MRIIACVIAAAGVLAVATPAVSQDINVRIGTGVHRPHGHVTVIKKRHYEPRRSVIRGDRGLHRGWRHQRHYGAERRVIVR